MSFAFDFRLLFRFYSVSDFTKHFLWALFKVVYLGKIFFEKLVVERLSGSDSLLRILTEQAFQQV